MSDLPYWLAMTRISVLGARRIMRLVEFAGSAQSAFHLSEKQLITAGLPPKVALAVVSEKCAISPDDELQRCLAAGISAVTVRDVSYPPQLREIYDPPPVLFYRGNIQAMHACSIAVVGSRQATAYGMAAAEKISAALVHAGICINSGMARGIDSRAHHGALSAGGKTVAVLGCGLDICYPPENRQLRERIVESGCIISEYPLGTQPRSFHFPMRNRIISGLSKAVIVVEAAEKSGALITADCALEQGRDVFAVPGSINSPYSKGCHKLIKEGAAVAECAEDILTALGLETAACTQSTPAATDRARQVLAVMEYEKIHFDVIMKTGPFSPAELMVTLAELEIDGRIKKLPGNFYLRV